MLGCRGVCRVQVFAVNFLLLLSAAVFGARADKDFSMVSHSSHSPTPRLTRAVCFCLSPSTRAIDLLFLRWRLNVLCGTLRPCFLYLLPAFYFFRLLSFSSFELLPLLRPPLLPEGTFSPCSPSGTPRPQLLSKLSSGFPFLVLGSTPPIEITFTLPLPGEPDSEPLFIRPKTPSQVCPC